MSNYVQLTTLTTDSACSLSNGFTAQINVTSEPCVPSSCNTKSPRVYGSTNCFSSLTGVENQIQAAASSSAQLVLLTRFQDEKCTNILPNDYLLYSTDYCVPNGEIFSIWSSNSTYLANYKFNDALCTDPFLDSNNNPSIVFHPLDVSAAGTECQLYSSEAGTYDTVSLGYSRNSWSGLQLTLPSAPVSKSGVSVGLIAGIAGGVVFILLIAGYFFMKKKRINVVDIETAKPAPAISKLANAAQSQGITNLADLEYDVMLSYSHNNTDIVVEIHNYLQNKGYKVWRDDGQISGNISAKITEGIVKSSIVIINMSQTYETSKWCQSELDFAKDKGKHIIPVRLDSGPYDVSLFKTGGNNTLYFSFEDVGESKPQKLKVLEQLEKQIKKYLDEDLAAMGKQK